MRGNSTIWSFRTPSKLRRAIDPFEVPEWTHCVAIHADNLFLTRRGLIQVYQIRDVQKPEFVSLDLSAPWQFSERICTPQRVAGDGWLRRRD